MVRDIRASAEVAAIVGSEDPTRLREGAAFGLFTCWRCGASGSADSEAATVIVELYDQVARVSLAHEHCAPSQVVRIKDAAPPGLVDTLDGTEMAVLAAVLSFPEGLWPVLILEARAEIATRSPAGERVDLLLSGLLGMGLTLMRSASHLPPASPGW